ncbi:hypothetical protein Taro_031625 [Colocasia esculenta]|uniref:Uncharacterized protein n=1 Tax=Colocasia esculenta TaxID=4460 RepID=A0A843W6Z2_COLES|nr:hypothetical protein [Colocasia esculenta]
MGPVTVFGFNAFRRRQAMAQCFSLRRCEEETRVAVWVRCEEERRLAVWVEDFGFRKNHATSLCGVMIFWPLGNHAVQSANVTEMR